MKLNLQIGILEVPDFKIKGREWLKSQVSRAFFPKYFPNYEKYLWIDCDAWVNDWQTIELYFKACDNNKLGIANYWTRLQNYLKSKLGFWKTRNN